jgi:two-component system, cell cycle sensor histidine kinase and response regulator CckA
VSGLVVLKEKLSDVVGAAEVMAPVAAEWLHGKYRQAASVIASNHGSFAAMRGSDARTAPVAAGDALAAVRGSGFLVAATCLVAGAVGVFALLASGFGEPILLTLMALLATVGVFFVLAALAGHVRLTGRMTALEFASGAADAIDDGIHITGRDGTPHFSSYAFRAFLGATQAGIPRSLEEVLAAEPRSAQSMFRLSRAAERGHMLVETFPLSRLAGAATEVRWYRLSVKPWTAGAARAGTGRLSVWQLSDVTADHGRESQNSAILQASLAIYDTMPVGLIVVDEAGCITHFNSTLADWLAMSPASRTRPFRLTDFVSADSAELLRTLARRRHGEAQPIDIDLLGQQGNVLAARLLVIEREFPEGSGGGFVAAVVKRSVEQAGIGNLKTTSARLSRLFEAAPFGVALVGGDGRISSANPAFSRLLLAPGKVEGVPALSLLGKEAIGGLRAPIEIALATAIAQKTSVAPVEVTVGESGEFTRRIVMSPLAGTANAPDAAVLYVLDATEQKTLEVNFAQSQKMEAVGKLAGGIAHDFNNVLTAIIGFSDLLLQTHRPSDAAYKNIMAIKSSANRAAGMVSQLLAFSRRQTLQPEVLALGETLGDLSVLLNRLLGEKIDLKIHQGRDLWYVKADRSQLSQVVINFAVNARDAMPDGGTLKISTHNLTERESQRIEQPGFTVGEYVVIEVEDTGHGMTPEVMAKIFEPFFTTKGVGKGTGLGLSTVYGIVKQTGGFVFPESGPGRGTTFRVYLPRYHVDNIEEIIHQKAPKKERAVDLTGTGCVLLVEDEDAVRGFAVEALRRQGYEVLQACSGAEALEVIAATDKTINLVVSDVIMPEMDGPTLLKELRRTQPDLKFVFMSGYPDDAFKNTLDPNTEFAFLQKPFSLMQLATKVKEQLGR